MEATTDNTIATAAEATVAEATATTTTAAKDAEKDVKIAELAAKSAELTVSMKSASLIGIIAGVVGFAAFPLLIREIYCKDVTYILTAVALINEMSTSIAKLEKKNAPPEMSARGNLVTLLCAPALYACSRYCNISTTTSVIFALAGAPTIAFVGVTYLFRKFIFAGFKEKYEEFIRKAA
jgi:hypothetical protein